MSEKKVVGISQILMHENPHLDEYAGLYLLRTYGEQFFPGIKTAYTRYVAKSKDLIGTDEEFDCHAMLPIGIGGGRFDEHRPEIERIPDACATTLVSDYLGLSGKPELKLLIDEVLACDTGNGVRSTELPELIKVAHRCHPGDKSGNVMRIVFIYLDAIINQEKFHFVPHPKTKSLLELFQEQVDAGHYSDHPKVRQAMFNFVHASMREKGNSIFELAYIVECLYQKFYSEQDISSWVEFFLSAIQADQIEFQEHVETLKKVTPTKIWVQDGSREVPYKLLMVRSDSSQAQKAARYIGASVVLVVNSTGNCQIFVDSRVPSLNLGNAVRMIRWLELPENMKDKISWKELGVPGKLEVVPDWYYFKKGEMLFNSGKPTKIGLQAIIEVLRHSFATAAVKKWCTFRGIRMNPPAVPTQDQSLAA